MNEVSMIKVDDRVFIGILKSLNNYEKLWLWWLIWGDNPANIRHGDCDDN